jgi:hypothetical protein
VVSILVVVLVFAFAGCPLFPGGDDTDDTGDEEQEEQDDGADDTTEPTDGTVTVSLSGATAADGELLVAYAYDAGEIAISDPSRIRGVEYVEISGGTASVVLKESDGDWGPTSTEWVATAGESYDIYAYTTSDDTDLSYVTGSRVDADYPTVATIDGDHSVSVSYADMVANFFAADLSGATDHVGEDFVVGVFPRGAEPGSEPDPMLAMAKCTVGAEGAAYVVVQDVNGGAWEGTSATDYDVYMFIDLDSNEWPGPGDWHYYDPDAPGDPGDPYQYTQSGNEYVETDYGEGEYTELVD